MKKVLGAVFGLLIVFLVIVVVAKNAILKAAVEQSVTRLTGFKTTVESLQYRFPSTIQIKGLEIQNPPGFNEKVFVNIPEIFAWLELQELLKNKKIHLPEVRLNLQEVHLEKNPQGISNLELLSSVGGKSKTQEDVGAVREPPLRQPMPFQLDRLELTIRKVTYEDRAGLIGAVPVPRKKLAVDLNVQQEVFTNITDPQALVNLILVKILNSATLGRILDIDPKQLLGDNAAKVLNSGQQIITQQAALFKEGVGTLAGQATSTVNSTTSAAKERVSGLLGKLKSLQSSESIPEKPQAR